MVGTQGPAAPAASDRLEGGCMGAAESTGLGVSIWPTGRLEPWRAGQISGAQRPLWSHCETQEKQREGSGTVMSGSGGD